MPSDITSALMTPSGSRDITSDHVLGHLCELKLCRSWKSPIMQTFPSTVKSILAWCHFHVTGDRFWSCDVTANHMTNLRKCMKKHRYLCLPNPCEVTFGLMTPSGSHVMDMWAAFGVRYSLVGTEMHHFWSRDIICGYVTSLLDMWVRNR